MKCVVFLFETSQRYDLPAGGQFSIAKIVSGVKTENHNVGFRRYDSIGAVLGTSVADYISKRCTSKGH